MNLFGQFHNQRGGRFAMWLSMALLSALPCTADDSARGGAAAEGAELRQAQQLLLTGKYAEAAEAFEQLADARPTEAAVGRARVLAETGRASEARAVLEQQLATSPDEPRLAAELASLALARGDWESAKAHSTGNAASLPLARWVQAELMRLTGQLDAAQEGYRWFIDQYNGRQIDDVDELLLIGRAAAMHARWNRASDQFQFLVTELYPDILQLEPKSWRAAHEAGLLFLEKFNQADAARQFERALAINPRAAEVHAAKAHLALHRYEVDVARDAIARALAMHPGLLSAQHAKADLLMMNFDVEGAAVQMERALEQNPLDEETLGRLAAAYAVLDADLASARVQRIVDEATTRNPAAGVFFFRMGQSLEERRRFDAAIECFHRALACMPQHIGPHASLGMLYMRLGEEEQAQEMLDQAFEADPFNVRVNNTLQVLEVLADYETLETEHFFIRFDPNKDRLLAQYAAQHMEEVYAELCPLLDYYPQQKTLIEIFNRAKNTSGHSWFSARTIGLPYVGTVGACTGKMVALTSPNQEGLRFNWARVLKHEFVHVVNLQQTDFNVPHWFTEALAVWHEGFARPAEWNELLRKRLAAGTLFDLQTINLGFIRPESNIEWQLAYCQAELYAEYMLERFGDDAFARLLAAYADGRDTRSAIAQAFDVEQQDFDAGYREYLQRVVAALGAGDTVAERSADELERRIAAEPDNAQWHAELAQVKLTQGATKEAQAHAQQALRLAPGQPVATYVTARLHVAEGNRSAAIELLDGVHDAELLHEPATGLLAALRMEAGEHEQAMTLFAQLDQRYPHETRWTRHLAKAALLAGQNEPLRAALVKLADHDPDDVTIRKKLAQLALERENYEEGAEWARRALDIQVKDSHTHGLLGEALLGLDQATAAVHEYTVAVDLAPDDHGLRYSLALAYAAAGDTAGALSVVREVLRRAPEYPGAEELLEKLQQ